MASSSASSSSSSSSREPSPIPLNTKALKRKLQSAQEDAEASGSGDSDSDTEKLPKQTKAKAKEKKQKKSKPEDAGGVSDTADAESAAVPEVEDVPVISHAERRRQKRLAKQLAAEQAAEAEGSATKKRKLKDGSAKDASSKTTTTSSGEKTRQHSVWVGNLSFKTTQENLKAFFANAGEVTRVNMPTKVASRPNLPLENKGLVPFLSCYDFPLFLVTGCQYTPLCGFLDLRMLILRHRKRRLLLSHFQNSRWSAGSC